MDIYKEEDFYKKEGYPTSDGGTGSLSRGYKYPRYAESDRGLNLSGFFIRISVESLFFITIEVTSIARQWFMMNITE